MDSSVRSIRNFGIQYDPSIFMITLSNVAPGYEDNIASHIDRQLLIARAREVATQQAHHARRRAPIINTVADAMQVKPEDLHPRVPSSTASHFATFGHFDLASIFLTSSFGMCHRLAQIPNVISQRSLIGVMPKPLPDGAHDIWPFCQDGDELLSFMTSVSKQREFPLIAICQLQIDPLLSTIIATNMVLPALLLFSRKIQSLGFSPNNGKTGKNVHACFIDSSAWGHWTVVLFGGDYNELSRIIYRIRQTSLHDLKQEMSRVADPMDLKGYDEKIRQIEKQLKGCNAPDNRIRLLSTSYTILGGRLGLVKDCLEDKIDESNKIQRTQRTAKWQVRGEVTPNTFITIKPGREREVRRLLEDAGVKLRANRYMLGKPDIHLMGSNLAHRADGQNLISTLDLFKSLYFIQWNLLGSPKLPGEKSRQVRHWRGDKDGLKVESTVANIYSNIECAVPSKDLVDFTCPDGSCRSTLPELYRAAFEERLPADREKFLLEIKQRYVSRSLAMSMLDLIVSWADALKDYYLSSQMIELANAYWVMCKSMQSILGKNNRITRFEMEDFLKEYIADFARSFNHRFLGSYHMIEHNDALTEYKGGLTMFITALDGFAKSIVSLGDDCGRVGILSALGHESNAAVCVQQVFRDGSHKDSFLHAAVHVNWTHVAHPSRLRTVLHECCHVLIKSDPFQRILKKRGRHHDLGVFLNWDEKCDTKYGLDAHRLKEITTEILVARLLFKDNMQLYTRTTLVQIMADVHCCGYQPNDNFIQRVEHLTRCFVVWLVCTRNLSTLTMKDLQNMAEQWFNDNSFYIYSPDQTKTLLCREFVNEVCNWLSAGGLNRFQIKELLEIVDLFLAQRSTGKFAIELAQMTAQVPYIKEQLAHGRPVYFEAPAPRTNGYNNVAGLSSRRTALQNYLLLLRAFLEIIDEWTENGRDRSTKSDIYTERKDGQLNFEQKPHTILYDEIWSMYFFTHHTQADAYIKTRYAMLKSMWHLSETEKYDDLLAFFKFGFIGLPGQSTQPALGPEPIVHSASPR